MKSDNDVTHRGEKRFNPREVMADITAADGEKSMMIEEIFERDNWVKMYRCVYLKH